MAAPLHVAVAGLGTVGAATVDLLARSAGLIATRTGRPIEVVAVSARDRAKPRPVDVAGLRWVAQPRDLAAEPGVDVVCELMGGADGIALDLCRAALESGKHVVTANKALLAHHGAALAALAERRGVTLRFEAAVAGGIPIVKALKEGLAANRVERVQGILNGTSNYILTAMRETGRDFADVLAEAQTLGYAEADPSFDVDGIDAAHKLALLAALAFGGRPRFDAIHIEGIRHVTAAGLEQRLHPAMVRHDAPIAQVDGVLNGITVDGCDAGTVMLEGRGAGAGPTASAVVADLVDLARGQLLPAFGVPAVRLLDLPIAPIQAHRGRYYLRLQVLDRPGVLADIAAILRDQEVSIEALIQRARNPGQGVPIVFTTHATVEAAMAGALAQIGALEAVLEPPRMIRIEDL